MADGPRRARAPRTSVDPARQTAYDVLRAVDTDDAYLNLVLPRLLGERGVTGRDAAFATELAAGTARLQGSYDAILDELARGGTKTLEPAVLTAMRLGAHQLLSMRVPSHAAVGTTVELVRADVGERPVRMVNAVLRRVGGQPLDAWLDQVAPARSTDLVGHLAVRHSHPRWIVDEFLRLLGEDGAEELLAADNVAPSVTLAGRPGLAVPRGDGIAPGRWSPYAGVLEGGDPGAIPDVRTGLRGRAGRGLPAGGPGTGRGDGRRVATSGGSTCVRDREARRRCSPGWPASAARCWSRTSGCRIAPPWSGPRCVATGRPRPWCAVTAPDRRGGRGRSTG